MIKVLHVIEPLASGILHSISKICWALHQDVEFHVLHGTRAETPADYRCYFPPDVRFISWRVAREINAFEDVTAMLELRRAVARIRPDVIHAHSSKAGVLARLPWVVRGRPVIYSPRGYAFLRQDVSAASRRFYFLIERLLGLRPHLTVACGEGERQAARQASRRVVLIPNMVDPEDFADIVPARLSPARMRVAMVGGIRPQKNFALFAEVADAVRDLDIAFVWIGGGAPPELRVPGNVTITGWLPRREALGVLASCQVFLQTSLWEGLSIALLEGMALGLAVLAKPAVGNTELVLEGVNGYLCDEAPGFAQHLRRLAADADGLERLGRASRELVARRFSAASTAPRWRELYRLCYEGGIRDAIEPA